MSIETVLEDQGNEFINVFTLPGNTLSSKVHSKPTCFAISQLSLICLYI